jgi:hypothetical protein
MLARMSYSWQSTSAAPTVSAPAIDTSIRGAGVPRERPRPSALARRLPRAELSALIALAALLNLWALSRNGWANDYYSAAVRSMSASWHNFLFASADPSGVMSVDKPPLALWVQALSARAFGYHPLSVLVPQALIGVASVALCYDLVRRRFGRVAGFVAGLALALTPITVAISRHNNPDALLVLCCVAALWFAARALGGRGRNRGAAAGARRCGPSTRSGTRRAARSPKAARRTSSGPGARPAGQSANGLCSAPVAARRRNRDRPAHRRRGRQAVACRGRPARAKAPATHQVARASAALPARARRPAASAAARSARRWVTSSRSRRRSPTSSSTAAARSPSRASRARRRRSSRAARRSPGSVDSRGARAT